MFKFYNMFHYSTVNKREHPQMDKPCPDILIPKCIKQMKNYCDRVSPMHGGCDQVTYRSLTPCFITGYRQDDLGMKYA